jgi:hypothetical protein
MIGKIFKFLAIGVLALIGIGVAFTLIGIAIALAIKVAVIGLVGFGIYKLVGGGKPKPPEISAEDRKWLNS